MPALTYPPVGEALKTPFIKVDSVLLRVREVTVSATSKNRLMRVIIVLEAYRKHVASAQHGIRPQPAERRTNRRSG